MHPSYQVGEPLQVYGLVQDVFGQHYCAYGGLFGAGALPRAAHYLTDPRIPDSGGAVRGRARLRYTIVRRKSAPKGSETIDDVPR